MINDNELDNVIYRYNERKNLAQVTLTKDATNEILGLLQELKQWRETELKKAVDDLVYAEKMQALLSKMKQEYDKVENELKHYKECELRPATRFKTATIEDQLAKIKEEFDEVRSAFYKYDIVNLVEELGDLQAACVTMLNMMALDEKARMNLRKSINEKNGERGYFDEPVENQNRFSRESDELSKAAAPLIELMRRKYNPHNKIIVTLDRVEVLSGEMGISLEVQD